MAKTWQTYEVGGFVGKDPQVREIKGFLKMTFSVATDESYFKKSTNEWVKDSEWHNIEYWGQPEKINKLMDAVRARSFVRCVGKRRTATYTSKKTGEEVKYSYMRASAVDLVAPPMQRTQAPTNNSGPAQTVRAAAIQDDPDEDLPF